jgi:hypothetical protein
MMRNVPICTPFRVLGCEILARFIRKCKFSFNFYSDLLLMFSLHFGAGTI